ncbi:hypothetical protein ACV67C_003343 [Salmonella enterica]
MKKIFLSGFLLLVGCSSQLEQQNFMQESNARQQEINEKLKKGDMPNTTLPEDILTKSGFSKQLTKYAFIEKFEEIHYHHSMDTLNMQGKLYEELKDVSDAIITCSVNQVKSMVNSMQEPFEKLKKSTKNKDERKALISVFSAWEEYMRSPTNESEVIFREKLSYYKNI